MDYSLDYTNILKYSLNTNYFFQILHLENSGRIVGGVGVSHSQFPFLVSIEYHDDFTNEWITTCGGSIINTFTILTACHCATADEKIHGTIKYIADPATRRIVAGTSYWNRNSATEQIARTDRIVTHPKCQNFYTMDRNFINDVALYFLKDALVYGIEVQPLSLPSTNIISAVGYLENLVNSNSWCTTVGWGRTIESKSDQSETLIGAPVQLLRPDECRKRFCQMTGDHCGTDFDRAGQFCVASPKASDCFGDSGGPLICNGYVVGIVSYGDRCLPNLPTVYQGLGPILEILSLYTVTVDTPNQGMSNGFNDDSPRIPITLNTPRPDDRPVLRELREIRILLKAMVKNKRSKI